MSIPQRIPDKRYSYADYLTWGDEERWEIIDGVPYAMSPSPLRRHQRVLGRLYLQVGGFLEGKVCQVYLAPLDVRFPKFPSVSDEEVFDVVEPDLFVVCDEAKLDERGCVGAPDLVIEILSDSTSKRDWKIKKELYERNGVREYWVVNPWANLVDVFRPGANGLYETPFRFAQSDFLETPVLPGLRVDLAAVFIE